VYTHFVFLWTQTLFFYENNKNQVYNSNYILCLWYYKLLLLFSQKREVCVHRKRHLYIPAPKRPWVVFAPVWACETWYFMLNVGGNRGLCFHRERLSDFIFGCISCISLLTFAPLPDPHRPRPTMSDHARPYLAMLNHAESQANAHR